MRQLWLGVLGLSACLVALASAANAAQPQRAVFSVTLRGTLTKEWTYTDVDNIADCVRIARGSGSTTTRLSMKRSVRIRASTVGARVRFSGSLTKIAGTVVRSSSRTITTGGDLPCEQRTVSEGRCAKRKATFRGASSAPRNPRKGVLQLASLRRARPTATPACPPEPRDIAAIRADLPLATGPLDIKEVFNRDIPGFFVTGNTTQETTLTGDLQGKVVERVRWTLVFMRRNG